MPMVNNSEIQTEKKNIIYKYIKNTFKLKKINKQNEKLNGKVN